MSYRVLVVDDTNFMRKMATDCLKQHGYEVAGEAVNGREAVKLYEELLPDIVLMDLTMPEMNGIDAIKEILKINPDAVVLICSASNQQDMILYALDAGAKGYLMKPFNPDRLYETIHTYAEPYLGAVRAAELESSGEQPAEQVVQEEVTEQVYQLENENFLPTEAANSSHEPAKVIKLANGNEKVRSFTSSYVCSWQEDIHGETANYIVIYNKSEDKVVIELMRPNQEKQSIPFTLDGFHQLTDWLENHIGGRVGNI
jgi:DNA-binding NarL/FixJ family response regulator